MSIGVDQIKLSIIIPVFNESEALSGLFSGLGNQRGLEFELLLCDGGSGDGTPELAERLKAKVPFACRCLHTAKGRARQMNAGVRSAKAEMLLFMHVDSSFSDPLALRKGVDALAAAIEERGDQRIAGHFGLRFRRTGPTGPAPSFGYYFNECRARLHRPHCTYGDQGFLLRRSFFEEAGPFDETLPLLEDVRFAEAVRGRGSWLLLPAEMSTSARRFETEGFFERQVLNVLIMNFHAIGWEDFFREASRIYPTQDHTQELRLRPVFRKIREMVRALPREERREKWRHTGEYVRKNAWQLAFALDARQRFRKGLPPGADPCPWLHRYDRWFDRLVDNRFGRTVATVLVWSWFHLMRFWLRHRERER